MFSEKKYHLTVIWLLIIANILSGITAYELSRPVSLRVIFFDVGQGDAIFIQTPLRHKILIDGGPGAAVLEKINEIMPFWDRHLDAVILTHPDHDHLGGLIEVVRNYQVGSVIMPETDKINEEIKEWQAVLKNKPAKIHYGTSGNKIISGDVYLKIVHPGNDTLINNKKDTNDDAIVAKLSFDNVAYLFTSDINSKTEKEIIKSGYNLKSSVLKVAHHGSAYSTTSDFLKSVDPKVAIISVGENNYGQPSEKVFKRLLDYGIRVLRTDISGNIVTVTNGEKIKVTTEK